MNSRYLNVGSWNIEHFGRAGDENSENQYAIAQHIELGGVDILALQELYVTGGNRENSHLRSSLDLVEEHTGNSWEYEIFRNRNAGDKSQLCGVAWNASKVAKVKTVQIPVETSVETNIGTLKLWDRLPHAVKFETEEGKTDLVVVSLHMKSNVGRRNEVVRKRHEESKTLLANLDFIKSEMNDEDIVFLGDTNCKSRTEGAIQEFLDHGYEDLNEDDISTYVKGSAPFDRIFVPSGEDRKPFLYSRQYILRSASPHAHDIYLSDHYIIKTMVKIRRDDD